CIERLHGPAVLRTDRSLRHRRSRRHIARQAGRSSCGTRSRRRSHRCEFQRRLRSGADLDDDCSGAGSMTSSRSRMRLVKPTIVTSIAVLATLAVVGGTAAFLVRAYPTLPDLLPVRFNARSRPIGWQYKTYVRVL